MIYIYIEIAADLRMKIYSTSYLYRYFQVKTNVTASWNQAVCEVNWTVVINPKLLPRTHEQALRASINNFSNEFSYSHFVQNTTVEI